MAHHVCVARTIRSLASSPSAEAQAVSARARGRITVAFGVVAVVVNIALIASLVSLLPSDKAALQVRRPVPVGDEFAWINRVSHWPGDWTVAVCKTPVYGLKTPNVDLPHATQSGACTAKIEPAGEYLNITIARFRSELEMQVDLHNQGYELYSFAFDQGGLLVYAIFPSATNIELSVVLQPLEKFGFNVYHDPGP